MVRSTLCYAIVLFCISGNVQGCNGVTHSDFALVTCDEISECEGASFQNVDDVVCDAEDACLSAIFENVTTATCDACVSCNGLVLVTLSKQFPTGLRISHFRNRFHCKT